jgi:predicted SnoaL-like aldol condensation-catalyzing enzyme
VLRKDHEGVNGRAASLSRLRAAWGEVRNPQPSESHLIRRGYGSHEEDMSRTKESQNKGLVLEAFDTIFNKRDYVAAERYWSPHYIQHSAHIEPGRDGLFNLIRSVPATLKYEPGVIVADGDFVIVHGRFSGHGRPKSWIAADILRIVDGVLVEHWDVLQDEATRAESKSGLPMFGSSVIA